MAVIIPLKEVSDRKVKPVSNEPAGGFQLLFFTGVRYERQTPSVESKPTPRRATKLNLKKA